MIEINHEFVLLVIGLHQIREPFFVRYFFNMATTVKRQRQVHNNKAQAGVPSLPFGIQRRLLPSDCEELAFSFLDVDDWAALSFVSHGLWQRVVSGLQGLRTLHCRIEAFGVRAGSSHGVVLAQNHCRQLHHVHISALEDPCHWKECGVRAQPWLVAVIRRNALSLRAVHALDNPAWSLEAFDALAECPLLEDFSPAKEGLHGRALSRATLQKLKPERLSHLRVMALKQDHKSAGDVCQVVQQGIASIMVFVCMR